MANVKMVWFLVALSSGREVSVKTVECAWDYAYIEEVRIKYQ